MLSVYENAWLTIAAAKSPNDRDSLFSKGSVRRLYTTHGRNTTETFVSRRIFHHHDGFSSSDASSIANKFPLLTRAWVFQERLLSPRILHFNFDEVSWDGNEIATCVCQGCIKLDWKQKHARLLGAGMHDSTLARTWRELVTHYSGLDLTAKSDRLPAIAGLARQMESYRAGKYIARLWSDDFYQDLLWVADHSSNLKPQSEQRFAPSWSWGSIDNKVKLLQCDCVQMTSRTYMTHCRLIGTKCPSLSSEYLTDLRAVLYNFNRAGYAWSSLL